MTRLARGTCDNSVEPGKGDKPIFLMLAERALSKFAGHIEEDTRKSDCRYGSSDDRPAVDEDDL